MNLKNAVMKNKLPSFILLMVLLMDLAFYAQQYTAAAGLLTVSIISLLALMLTELRK